MKQPEDKRNLRDAEYYYSEISPDVEKTFTREQKEAVKSILKRAVRVPSKKIVDFRTTFWLFKHLYLVLFIGIDRRRKARKDHPEQQLKVMNIVTKTVLVLFFFLIALSAIFWGLYIVKYYLGIDIFPDKHLFDILPGGQ